MEAAFSWLYQNKFERGKQWYLIAATCVITFVIVCFLVGAFLLGILGIIFTGVYLLYDINAHSFFHIEVCERGIFINQDLYEYAQMTHFCLVRADGKPFLLRFFLQGKMDQHVDLFLDPNIDIESLLMYVSQFATQSPMRELGGVERIFLSLKI